jgi:hypothetical protein
LSWRRVLFTIRAAVYWISAEAREQRREEEAMRRRRGWTATYRFGKKRVKI